MRYPWTRPKNILRTLKECHQSTPCFRFLPGRIEGRRFYLGPFILTLSGKPISFSNLLLPYLLIKTPFC
jgi:hypothetical protein